MKVSIGGLGFGDLARPEIIAPLVTGCEELGFSTVWTGEHVVLPVTPKSDYPYSRGTGPPFDTNTPVLNPLIMFAWAAAMTTRLRFGTSIVILPEHNPLMLAKTAASLDYLSGGRLILGIGLGWIEQEFDAVQIPGSPLTWKGRAKQAREAVEAMRSLWEDSSSSYQGATVAFDDMLCYPKPVNGTIPVYYGGHTDIALKRAARYCNGILFNNLTPDETAERISTLHEMLADQGRSTDDFGVRIAGLYDMTPDQLPDYAATGAHELMLQPHHLAAAGAGHYIRVDQVSPAAVRPALEQLAEEWVKPAAALERTKQRA
jgi:probable F420-dependent oxidoreductase